MSTSRSVCVMCVCVVCVCVCGVRVWCVYVVCGVRVWYVVCVCGVCVCGLWFVVYVCVCVRARACLCKEMNNARRGQSCTATIFDLLTYSMEQNTS